MLIVQLQAGSEVVSSKGTLHGERKGVQRLMLDGNGCHR